jgi:hypothetical protein
MLWSFPVQPGHCGSATSLVAVPLQQSRVPGPWTLFGQDGLSSESYLSLTIKSDASVEF